MTLDEACACYETQEPRGEYVVVIEGKTFSEVEQEENDRYSQLSIEDHVRQLMAEGLDRKAAIKQAAVLRGIPKREVYDVVCRGK